MVKHGRRSNRKESTLMSRPILPVIVSPKEACIMLSCGLTRLSELIKAGDLVSFKDGKSRKITVQSIYDLINRRLQEQDPNDKDEYSIRSVHQPRV